MSNKPEVISEHASISMLTNSLFWVGLFIAILLVAATSIAGAFHWLSEDALFHVLAQIIVGSVIGGTTLLFIFPRMQLILGKTNSLTKCANIFVTLLGLALLSFLLTFLSTLWSPPKMNFLEKTFSNLGFVAGVTISLRMYHSRSSLH